VGALDWDKTVGNVKRGAWGHGGRVAAGPRAAHGAEPARNMIGLGTRELSNLRIRENGLVAPVFIKVQKRHESCARSRTETNREGGMEGDRGF